MDENEVGAVRDERRGERLVSSSRFESKRKKRHLIPLAANLLSDRPIPRLRSEDNPYLGRVVEAMAILHIPHDTVQCADEMAHLIDVELLLMLL